MTEIQKQLFALQDLTYRDFHAKLIPTIDRQFIIGVRTPALRRLAKSLVGTKEAALFLQALPHTYYEENNLHAFLIEQIKDPPALFAALDAFLPFVDNWATCDSLRPPLFKKHPAALLPHVEGWLSSGDVYTVRYGIGMLLSYYLDEQFDPLYLERVAAIRSEEYYIRMMVAWYFATALAKQYEAALPFITARRLEPWTHNKSIQKAIESYRITPEQKAYLRAQKIG